ncbi:MAG: hypothetical protein R6V85_11320 [Polyangia bacterium]
MRCEPTDSAPLFGAPSPSRAAAASLAALAAVLWAGIALGDETDEPLRVVMLLDADRTEVARPVTRAVEAQLSDLDVELVIEELEALPEQLPGQVREAEAVLERSGALAVLWFDFTGPSEVYLHISGPESDRVLVRRLEPAAGEVGLAEELAIIVRATVEALLSGGRIGVAVEELAPRPPLRTESGPPPPFPPDRPEPRLEPEPSAASRLALLVGYALHMRSSDHLAVHGLAIGLEARVRGPLFLSAGYRAFSPIETRGELADVRVARHPAQLGMALAFDLGRLRLGAGVEMQLDYLTEEVSNLADGMRRAGDLDDLELALLPRAELLFRLAERLAIRAAAGAELPLNPRHFTAKRAGRTEVLVDTWSARPLLELGIAAFLL